MWAAPLIHVHWLWTTSVPYATSSDAPRFVDPPWHPAPNLIDLYMDSVLPAAEDPTHPRTLAESVKLLVIVFAGVTLSLLIWRRRAAWAAVALACLAGIAFIFWYGFDGLVEPLLCPWKSNHRFFTYWRGMLLRPDPLLLWYVLKGVFLLLSLIFWPSVYLWFGGETKKPTAENLVAPVLPSQQRFNRLGKACVCSTFLWAMFLIPLGFIFRGPTDQDFGSTGHPVWQKMQHDILLENWLQLVVIVSAGVALSLLVGLRRKRWAAVALACLACFACWHWYRFNFEQIWVGYLGTGNGWVDKLGFIFSTPQRSTGIGIPLPSLLVLLSCVKALFIFVSLLFWPVVYVRLSRELDAKAAGPG